MESDKTLIQIVLYLCHFTWHIPKLHYHLKLLVFKSKNEKKSNQRNKNETNYQGILYYSNYIRIIHNKINKKQTKDACRPK